MSATRLSLVCLLSTLLLVLFASQVEADSETNPISIFRSRPDLEAPILTIIDRKPELQAPGFYFLSPYQTEQEGVYIYDNDANLVYSAFGSDGSGVSHSPRTCQYDGRTHLCFYQGRQMTGWGHGHGVIMDEHYRVVKSVEPSGSYQASSDMHEFVVTKNGKSALMTQYVRSVYDLCVEPWNLCDGLGYIHSGVFQEVDIETGNALFEWNSLDHIDPRESWVPPSTTEISGSGEHPSSPWDYFHINSVDKNDEGDYLISARHCSAVYKISGKNGKVLWRLNGLLSDYTLVDGLAFSSQHDARFVSDNNTMTVISLYDNASNGFNVSRSYSQGLIIAIDHTTKEARAIHVQDPPPETFHSSRSQGNFQLLSNGNKIMCYGNDAFFSEHNSTGDVVFYGYLALTSMMNYRVHKSNDWIGRPLTKPAVWTYSKYGYPNSTQSPQSFNQENNVPETEAGMTIYISWNGATEVTAWRIYVSTSSSPNPSPPISDLKQWNLLTTISKSGFETIYKHPTAHRYVYVEALDKSSNILGQSAVQEAFVPNVKMRDGYCDDLACKFMPSAEERELMKLGEENRVDGDGDGNSDMKAQAGFVGTQMTIAVVVVVGVLLSGRWVLARVVSGRRGSWTAVKGRVMDVLGHTGLGGRAKGEYQALRLEEVLEDGDVLGDGDVIDERLFHRGSSPMRR